jgi:hypothetical protein
MCDQENWRNVEMMSQIAASATDYPGVIYCNAAAACTESVADAAIWLIISTFRQFSWVYVHLDCGKPLPDCGLRRQMHRHPVYVRQCVTKRFQSIQELSTAMLLLHVQNPSPMPQSGSSSQHSANSLGHTLPHVHWMPMHSG